MMVRIDFFFLMSYLAKEKLSHSLFTLSPPNFFEHFIGLWNLKVWEPLSYGVMAPASSPAQWNQASRKNRSVRRDEGRRRDWVSDIHDHTEISLKAHWESIYCVSNPGLRPWRGKRKKRPLQEVLAAWEAEKLLEPSSLLDLSIQTMGRRSSDMARSMGLEWSSCLPGGGRLYLSMEGSRVWRDRKRSSGLSSEGTALQQPLVWLALIPSSSSTQWFHIEWLLCTMLRALHTSHLIIIPILWHGFYYPHLWMKKLKLREVE